MKIKHFGLCAVKIFLCCLLMLTLLASAFIAPAMAADEQNITARPSVTGRLHLEGQQLVGENGQPVVLHGVSTHGLTYYPSFVNRDLLAHVSRDWNANLVRLAVYAEDYCNGNQKQNLKLLKNGIQYAIDSDMYILVDWHVLEQGNPNRNLAERLLERR